jgi:hypothetical protein
LDGVDAGGLEEADRRDPASLTRLNVRHLARHHQVKLAAMVLVLREAAQAIRICRFDIHRLSPDSEYRTA